MSIAKRALELSDKDPLKKEIINFLGGNENRNVNLKKCIYTGKSKKIISKEVFIVKKGKTSSKIRDIDGNELTVSNKFLI